MTDPYSSRAQHFFSQYQQLAFDDVHQSWLHHLPDQPGFALDVGAGSLTCPPLNNDTFCRANVFW